VSVLIPTLNEAATLADTLASVRTALGPHTEIIVSDAGSCDSTHAVAEAHGARVVATPGGRGAQLDAALRAATGDVCILLHADTTLPSDALVHIERALERSDVVGGAFFLEFNNGLLPWLARGINLRSRLFNTATGDQAMFARREVLLRVGGIPHVELFEDVRVWQKLKRAGRLELLQARVTTSARLWMRFGTWRVIRLHLRLRLLHALGVQPHRLARMYPTSGS
jgi:uncharacterized protein